MTPKHEQLVLALLCLFITLLALGGLVWAFQATLLAPQVTMDGLLLVLICLTMAAIFGAMFYTIAKQLGGWAMLPVWRRTKAQPEPMGTTRAATANPGPQEQSKDAS
ncbi:MAG: hypothetical protein K6U02_06450 [Firmicutes bacterium]|nr:hypothetical protein [Bacillota bacterium]